jgi:CelD/BcsL family acetyltransferase involved in cellulose biosynthesis
MLTPRRTEEAKPPSLIVFNRLEEARAAWRTLHDIAPVSPYQDYDYVRLWFDAFAGALDVEPRVVVATDSEGLPLALLPLAIRRTLGLRVAEFACGRESNFNLALVRPGAVLDFRSLLLEAARASGNAFDLYFLRNQPRRFCGRDNPLVFPDACLSPSAAYGGPLVASLTRHISPRAGKRASYRRRRLASLGPLAFKHEATGDRRRDVITTLCAQKAQRLSHLGRSNPYSSEAMSRFLHALAEANLLEAHAMTVDGRIVATYVGVACRGRFSVLANSFDADSGVARFTPGEILLNALLENLSRRGFTNFDLGIGEAQYKEAVCDEAIELYDTVLAVSAAGALVAPILRASVACKRSIKRTPWLLHWFDRLRRARPLQAATV